jgi:hypothetical protein
MLHQPILFVLHSYMDTISLTKLEQCCHLLRHTIVTTREYKRRVRRMMGSHEILEEEAEQKQAEYETSFYYKKKLIQHLKR